ncbi:Oxysterol-binding protein 3 [Taxawa tesnikishii (nom. ined.)]|nr:Oxysterol-binding protein 3 [Dothideales sp. JES 119]
MEQIQVHSQSYIVRWINVSAGHSISWSLQPHKKSLNFGIFKHPGAKNGLTPNLPATFDVSATLTTATADADEKKKRRGSVARNDSSTVVEKLQSIGLRCVAWTGKCEADKVSMGTYNVGEGEGGMYGLVFDNTFSRQVSKTATFVLMTHPTNAPPKSQAHLHYSQAMAAGSTTSVAKSSPSLRPVADSTDSLPQDSGLATTVRGGPATRKRGSTVKASDGGNFHTGTLWKKRRKRNQDFTSATLSYYRNGHSSALRGAIPLSLAAVGVNEKRREFSVDSGAEVWHLKAGNKKDFEEWKAALERASNTAPGTPGPGTPLHTSSDFPTAALQSPADERDWERVEELVARVSGSRDAARRLAQDTDPKYHGPSPSNGLGISNGGSPSASSIESSSNPFFLDTEDKTSEKVPFWKRKPSSSGGTSPGAIFRRSVSAQVAVSAPSAVPAMSLNAGGGLSLQRSAVKRYHNRLEKTFTSAAWPF